MNCRKKVVDIVSPINPQISNKQLRGSLCLILIGLWLVLSGPLYGQGSLAETTTTLELQEQLSGSADQATPRPQAKKPKADANRPAEPNRHDEVSPKPAPETNNVSEQPQSGRAAGEQSTATVSTQDTNVPDMNDFNERELNRINTESRSVEGQWLGRLDKKAELVRAIDGLVAAELRFIRKFAAAEDANRTIRAIDLVVKQRKERLEKLVTKLENESKEERQRQVPERREKRPRPVNRQD
jgi:hypothetical protein